ncbi:2-isopropylmalate synthase [Brachyspira hyodysenteriae]|uniref:2-isopropylmalate synthase n=1 Tax=Brachyspira hyodysenteriae (strain ATCC 49526 / WA1) TaxID=565034 RepID=A0A3B6VAZ2_BRAHW|nr:2-isopropylmalate synthase [Brachyspira hyodysenteriae]ACN83527.1 2-isopropylmalate synthase [Brachyspira hyodysenteriae WA1]AUJ49263.1 2-isopropylmalate synthase [Brachyspira hyodysenteriae]KLI14228.1 2-isopropylmalate synthase [Brachyspira hyodysenteriae]KLI17034.1 2-isopropylmalate synthase [Brachyspira hyodysenteriae]KLI18378.1 2-isopropylmalate synthase [Brachyspira hyodysenteriae]
MRKIKIFDTTLRDGEQSPGCTMNLAEKLEMAAELDKLGVDVIEAGFAICSDDDFNAIREVSKVVENAKLASLARCNKKDIDRAYESLAEAKHPMLHTFIATSDIHLKHKLEMTREQVLETIKESVSYAKTKFEFIEFSAEDASRSDREFLAQAYSTAIENGATTINVPDTVGYTTPLEMADLIKYLKENVKGIENVDISVHCHDDLGLGTANSLSAVLAGATQVECTINGIGERAGNASLEEIVMGIKTRKDFYNAYTDINTKRIYKISKLLSTISGMVVAPNKAIVGANAFAHEAGIHQHGVLKERSTYEIMNVEDIGIPQNKMVLGKHSGKHAFKDRIESLGYDIDDKALEDKFIEFKALADKKKIVTDSDIEALLIGNNDSDNPIYTLNGFVVNDGNSISSLATVSIMDNQNNVVEGIGKGNGPIDAAFGAIDSITSNKAKLVNYSINAITEGEDALGEVIVKLASDDKTVIGRAVSTDIIEASLRAYVNGLNKL